ncbi:MAG: NADH-quinone oxidoreductase subunit NuoE, partial [Syntrophobacteraceae bacterium]|nr:NADH-quinone oxidoreductase subunit NuoE [Syntrophobacteraceae bacterium]
MEDKDKLKRVFAKHHRDRDALSPVLQDIQEAIGYLPPETMTAAARFCRIDPVEVYGVATFYAQFKFSPL